MGMVFQNYAVWPHKTVYQNVAFGLEVRKVGRTDAWPAWRASSSWSTSPGSRAAIRAS